MVAFDTVRAFTVRVVPSKRSEAESVMSPAVVANGTRPEVSPPTVSVAADGNTTEPALLIVVVLVPPKYAVPVFEKSVEDAFAKRWSAVQIFAFPIFKSTVAAAVSLPEFPTVTEPEDVSVAR